MDSTSIEKGYIMEPTSAGPASSFLLGMALAAIGWFGTAFGLGRKLTKIESGLSERISATDAKLSFIESRQNVNIEALKKLTSIESIVIQVKEKQDTYDETLARIDRFLLTRDGEPRFITYPAHDIMTKNCRDQLLAEINHIVQNGAELKAELAKMTDTLHKMAVHQAAIAGRRKADIGEDE